jgi:hypothetical protein
VVKSYGQAMSGPRLRAGGGIYSNGDLNLSRVRSARPTISGTHRDAIGAGFSTPLRRLLAPCVALACAVAASELALAAVFFTTDFKAVLKLQVPVS